MTEPTRSRRGVYYDLSKSPYEYHTPYGDLFKFSSKKKLEIYTRDVPKEVDRMKGVLTRTELDKLLPDEIVTLLYRTVYQGFYRSVEGIRYGKEKDKEKG